MSQFRLGVGSLLDVMHEELDDEDDSENAANDDEDYDKKSDTAEDFSDITELAEDLQTAMQVCARVQMYSIFYKEAKLNLMIENFGIAKYKSAICIGRL